MFSKGIELAAKPRLKFQLLPGPILSVALAQRSIKKGEIQATVLRLWNRAKYGVESAFKGMVPSGTLKGDCKSILPSLTRYTEETSPPNSLPLEVLGTFLRSLSWTHSGPHTTMG